MISAILTRSGGPPAAALITAADSRKYCGPIAAGVMAQRAFTVLAAGVVEPVNGAPRNAQGLPWPDVNRFAVHGPGQHPLDAVDCLFVVIVTVRRRRQPLRGRDRELEESDAASRVVSRDQETHGQRPEVDGLVGGIDVDVGRLRVPWQASR